MCSDTLCPSKHVEHNVISICMQCAGIRYWRPLVLLHGHWKQKAQRESLLYTTRYTCLSHDLSASFNMMCLSRNRPCMILIRKLEKESCFNVSDRILTSWFYECAPEISGKTASRICLFWKDLQIFTMWCVRKSVMPLPRSKSNWILRRHCMFCEY